MMKGMTFAFETQRLRVFRTDVTSWPEAGVTRMSATINHPSIT
jgi:hypothetical protein